MARMTDGHGTKILFSSNSDIELYEVRVTPPGIDGGDEIDTTIMDNSEWRTRAARALKTLTNSGAVVAYNPAALDDIVALVNNNQQITIQWPDGSEWTFWGFLKSFIPQEVEEGTMPVADIEIVPTNENNSGVEQDPVYTAP